MLNDKREPEGQMMRLVGCMLFAALLTATAMGITVPPMSASEFADTEVSTNLPISVCFAVMSRLAFTLSLDASPSNSVEIAVGIDGDGDGSLSPFEAAYAFGYDCGRWFVRDAARDAETFETEDRDGRVGREFLLRKRQLSEEWNLLRVTRRGTGAVGEMVLAEGRKPGYCVEVR